MHGIPALVHGMAMAGDGTASHALYGRIQCLYIRQYTNILIFSLVIFEMYGFFSEKKNNNNSK